MKVLVTGGGGFLGSWTVRELAQRGHEPVIFDRAGRAGGQMVILGDVRDATAVTEAAAHVDAVIHLAGVLGTAETITNPRPAAEVNVLGALNVFEACAQYGVPLVNISVGNWFEPSAYSISKHAAERFAGMYGRYRGLPVCTVRALNAYGPGQSVAQPYGPSRVRKIIPSFVVRALHGEPVQVFGDGTQVMDMIWAGDVAAVLAAALDHTVAHGAAGEPYEAGSGDPATVLDIATLVCGEVARQAGVTVPVEKLPGRAGESPGVRVCGDPATLAPLGITPAGLLPLAEGIARTVAWYREAYQR